jgi:hypothetical protein
MVSKQKQWRSEACSHPISQAVEGGAYVFTQYAVF